MVESKKRLLLLTILFTNPNFLILDEPTNDLDLPTLEVLEEFLQQYQGCLLLVSHDRYFMDKLVDHLFVFEGQGKVRDFAGNYSEYRERLVLEEKESKSPKQASIPEVVVPVEAKQKTRMSFKEKREWETISSEMESLVKRTCYAYKCHARYQSYLRKNTGI